MAGHYTYCVSDLSTVPTSGGIVVWALKQVTRPVTIVQLGVSLGGNAASTGLSVLLGVYSTASTGGGTATPGKWGDQSAPAATTTVRTRDTATGTLVTAGPQWYVQPFGGILDVQYPLMREPGMDSAVSDYLALVLGSNGIAVPYAAYVLFDEG